jgi:hypothetical protein
MGIESAAWTRISGRGDGPAVLAVDFDGSGRREATFRDLVKLFPDELDVWHAVPPDDGHLPGLPPEHYIDWWRGLPGGPETAVRAILGYCAGSVYASALADALESDRADRPTVVLFNPGVPTVATLDRDFTGIVDGLTVLDDAERSALRARARRARESSRDDFTAVSGEYVASYLEASATAFERYGISPDVGEQLTRLFRAYVNYLATARAVEVRPGWAASVALRAREQTGSGFGPDETVFDLSRADLLRDQQVASRTLELLFAKGGVR